MKKRGERQMDLGYTPAEELPGHTFEIVGNKSTHEAAAFTPTQRRRPAGFLNHDPLRHTIDSVYVSPEFRGKGIGPRMYEAAGRPAHSPELTKQGEKFARSVGGKIQSNIHRIPALDESGYQMMLPDMAKWIDEEAQ